MPWRASSELEVTLVDTKDFFEYSPMFNQVLFREVLAAVRSEDSDAEGAALSRVLERAHAVLSKITWKHREYLGPRVNVVVGRATGISVPDKMVTVRREDRDADKSADDLTRLPYDYLVLAPGSRSIEPTIFKPALDCSSSRARAQQLVEVTQRVLEADEILVTGAGTLGVELTGELSAALPDKHVTLADSHAHILGTAGGADFAEAIEPMLRALPNVELLLETRLHASPDDPREFVSTQEVAGPRPTVAADVAFQSVGWRFNTEFVPLALKNERGEIRVNEFLRCPDHANIFACGDAAAVPADDFKLLYNATYHADTVARNIVATVRGVSERKYAPAWLRGLMISVGPTQGYGHIGPGFAPQLVKPPANLVNPFKEVMGFRSVVLPQFGVAPDSGSQRVLNSVEIARQFGRDNWLALVMLGIAVLGRTVLRAFLVLASGLLWG